MDVYKIDVTGPDLFRKGYGIIVLYNNKISYGYKLPSLLQSEIRNYFNNDFYGFNNKKILKPKIYSAILSLILRQISKENQTETTEFDLHICNDFDGHQNNIIQWLRENCKEMFIFNDITSDNYHFRRHPKKSKIQQLALQLNSNDWTEIIQAKINQKELHQLIAKKKFKNKRW